MGAAALARAVREYWSKGMAAGDNHYHEALKGARPCLSGPALQERVEEEIARAERYGTALSCLLVGVQDAPTVGRVYGQELLESTLAYLGLALRREFRRFDRVGRLSGYEHLVVLPGADGVRGELIARRVLARVQAIKLEAHGQRSSLRMAIAMATWRQGLTAQELIGQARQATGRARQVAEPAPADSPLPVGPLGFA
jgi:GGDEF domain-containing protein